MVTIANVPVISWELYGKSWFHTQRLISYCASNERDCKTFPNLHSHRFLSCHKICDKDIWYVIVTHQKSSANMGVDYSQGIDPYAKRVNKHSVTLQTKRNIHAPTEVQYTRVYRLGVNNYVLLILWMECLDSTNNLHSFAS